MRSKGFSLIELLIVVAIILIIAAIAIPNLMKSRGAANEASAVSSVRNISTAQLQYKSTSGSNSYATTLATLGTAGAGLIDGQLATGNKSGYRFDLPVVTPEYFVATAEPLAPGVSGQRAFCTDGTVLHYDGTSTVPGTAGGCQATLGTTNKVLN